MLDKARVDSIKQKLKDQNLTLEQYMVLHRLMRNDIVERSLMRCVDSYNETAVERGLPEIVS